MRSIIIGGGKIGGELAARLLQRDSAVIVIEADEARARELSDRLPALVLVGDGTDMRRLEELDLRGNDFFVAVTGIDEDNLVACQLASAAFGVRRVLARMNDPRNREAFRVLGVPTVNVTDEMTAMIERDLEVIDQVQGTLSKSSDLMTVELTVGEQFATSRLGDLALPVSTVIVTLTRGDSVLVPDGDSRVEAGDRLMLVTHRDSAKEVADLLARAVGTDES